MIRAGIAGGTTTVAGEITKLLINHPDIEIQWIYDPEAEGALVSRVHKGLQGETYMRFSADAPMDNINVVSCASTNRDSRRISSLKPAFRQCEDYRRVGRFP